MEGKKAKSRAILVFGAPCSGKTTFAEKFAKKFDLAFFDFDTIKEENRLSNKNILLIVSLLARTRKTLIIEGGLATEKDRTEMRNVLRAGGYEPSLLWLQTDVNTIRTRMKNKYHSAAKAKELYDKMVNEIEAPTETERPIILSGKHTFETQARHALAGLAESEKK